MSLSVLSVQLRCTTRFPNFQNLALSVTFWNISASCHIRSNSKQIKIFSSLAFEFLIYEAKKSYKSGTKKNQIYFISARQFTSDPNQNNFYLPFERAPLLLRHLQSQKYYFSQSKWYRNIFEIWQIKVTPKPERSKWWYRTLNSKICQKSWKSIQASRPVNREKLSLTTKKAENMYLLSQLNQR